MPNNFFIKEGSLISGTVNVYSSLPTLPSNPVDLYENQLYRTLAGDGGKWPPLIGSDKYPAALYTPNEDLTEWEQSPFKIDIAEDTATVLNIVDWISYTNWIKDIDPGDTVIFNLSRYVNLTGAWTTTTPDLDDTNWGSFVDLASKPATSYKAGRIWYDGNNKHHSMDTGYTGVSVPVGRELQTEVYNNTGAVINNGDPVSLDGTFTGIYPNIVPTDSSNIFSAIAFTGSSTATIAAGATGLITPFGLITGVNTQSLIQGFIYADSGGWYTQDRPVYPEERIFVGAVIQTGTTDGILSINPKRLIRSDLGKSYGFTSQGIGAGLYYKGGFYEWATADANLTQASPTQTYGTVGRTYAAHAGIVPSGAGVVVGGGQVGLRVTGIKDSSTGIQQAGQVGIVTEDITTLTLNVMAETEEKFSGQITYELYVVTGTPTSYSLDFNYGYSKYEDLGNKQFTVTGLECVWQGNTLDTDFDIALKHHKPDGWTYAATGFLPGNGDIARKSVDQQLAGNVVNNLGGAWKRIELDTFINGAGLGGILFEIITTAPNTIQTMDLHIAAISEEL